MSDLILHISLPKTGTTTIQSSILADRSNFLGQEKHARCLPRSNDLARDLVRLAQTTLGDPAAKVGAEAVEWQRSCWSLLNSKATSGSSVEGEAYILSEKALASGPTLDSGGAIGL